MKNAVKNAAVLAGLLLLCGAAGMILGCPIKRIFAVPCPGCGMTRACLSLLKLDFAAALHWHPLCFLVPPLGLLYIFKDTRVCRKILNSKILPVLLFAAIMLTYILRMIYYFPSTPPMNIEENSLFVKIVHKYLLQ